MSELREGLENARRSYVAAQYEGDLGALAESASTIGTGRRFGWMGAGAALVAGAAATLFVAIAPTHDDPRQRQPSPTTAAAPQRVESSWLDRGARFGRYRGSAKRVVRLISQRKDFVQSGSDAWASPLAFARPQPPAVVRPDGQASTAETSATPASPPPRQLADRVSTSPRRRLSMSVPSLNLRRLNNANSIGT